jgi:hypothetical protein
MEVKEKILKGAAELFIRDGVRKVTMDQLASSLGISKRTIYENYRDKEDLIRNFLTKVINEHKSGLVKIINSSDNVIEALFRFGIYNRDSIAGTNPQFFEDLKKYYADMFEAIKKSEKIGNGEVSYLILKRGVNEGTFVKTIDIDLVNTFIHVVMNYFFNLTREDCTPPQKIWSSIFLPYIKGICTEKGLEYLSDFLSKNQNFSEA